MAETLISEICKIRQENKVISCRTEKKFCPKEYNKGVFRKECIGFNDLKSGL